MILPSFLSERASSRKWERKITEYHKDIQIIVHKNLINSLALKELAYF